jgi:hypothetical protein
MAIRAEHNEVLNAMVLCFRPWDDMRLFQRDRLTVAGAAVATLKKELSPDLYGYGGAITHLLWLVCRSSRIRYWQLVS